MIETPNLEIIFPEDVDFKAPHFSRYKRFIETRKLRELSKDCYTEKHHIIPKSLKGDDEKSNIIILSGREHFIAHLILWKGIGKKMIFAMHMMHNSKKYLEMLTSRQYARLKQEYIEYKSEVSKGYCVGYLQDGSYIYVQTNDPRWETGEIHGNRKGYLRVKDVTGNSFTVKTDDPRLITGEVSPWSKGAAVLVIEGKATRVLFDDPLYLCGKYKGVVAGKVLSDETREKISIAGKGRQVSEETKVYYL